MAKFLNVWRYDRNAPWPTDPAEMLELTEVMTALIDNALKIGDLRVRFSGWERWMRNL